MTDESATDAVREALARVNRENEHLRAVLTSIANLLIQTADLIRHELKHKESST